MMQKLSHEKAIDHIDAMMNKVTISKEASALEDADKNGVIPGTAAGTEKIPVTKCDNPDTKCEEKNPAEGEFSSEKHQDVKESTDGVGTEEMKANSDGNADPVATDFNAESIDKKSGENSMNEQTRISALGAAIREKMSKTAEVAEDINFEKLSAEDQEAVILFKQAADMHYMDYVESFAAGMQKKAEDVAAVMEGEGVPEEVATETLDDIAAENPELVIPAEEGGEAPAEGGEGELSEEDAAMLEELANQLEAEGVTPEELAEAVAAVDEEDGQVEKMASDRHEQLKAIVRSVR